MKDESDLPGKIQQWEWCEPGTKNNYKRNKWETIRRKNWNKKEINERRKTDKQSSNPWNQSGGYHREGFVQRLNCGDIQRTFFGSVKSKIRIYNNYKSEEIRTATTAHLRLTSHVYRLSSLFLSLRLDDGCILRVRWTAAANCARQRWSGNCPRPHRRPHWRS